MDEAEAVVETLRRGRLIHEDKGSFFHRKCEPPIYEDEWKRLVSRVKAPHPELAKFAGFGKRCCDKRVVGIDILEPPFAEGFSERSVEIRGVCRKCGRTFYSHEHLREFEYH